MISPFIKFLKMSEKPVDDIIQHSLLFCTHADKKRRLQKQHRKVKRKKKWKKQYEKYQKNRLQKRGMAKKQPFFKKIHFANEKNCSKINHNLCERKTGNELFEEEVHNAIRGGT